MIHLNFEIIRTKKAKQNFRKLLFLPETGSKGFSATHLQPMQRFLSPKPAQSASLSHSNQ